MRVSLESLLDRVLRPRPTHLLVDDVDARLEDALLLLDLLDNLAHGLGELKDRELGVVADIDRARLVALRASKKRAESQRLSSGGQMRAGKTYVHQKDEAVDLRDVQKLVSKRTLTREARGWAARGQAALTRSWTYCERARRGRQHGRNGRSDREWVTGRTWNERVWLPSP